MQRAGPLAHMPDDQPEFAVLRRLHRPRIVHIPLGCGTPAKQEREDSRGAEVREGRQWRGKRREETRRDERKREDREETSGESGEEGIKTGRRREGEKREEKERQGVQRK